MKSTDYYRFIKSLLYDALMIVLVVFIVGFVAAIALRHGSYDAGNAD